MEISADKAYWLFGYYHDRSIRLHVGGRIGGEEAACSAVITAIERESHRIRIELSDSEGGQSWDRIIPLRDASYSLHLLGEKGFEEWVARRWHSVLILTYPDGTTLFFAEQMH